MTYGHKIFFFIKAVGIYGSQGGIYAGNILLGLIAGLVIGRGAFHHPSAQFGIRIGADDGQGGKGNKTEDYKNQQDRRGAYVHMEFRSVFFLKTH